MGTDSGAEKQFFVRTLFDGLNCVGHFAYVAHFVFLRDVWIRTQRAAVATNLDTHLPNAAHLPNSHPLQPPIFLLLQTVACKLFLKNLLFITVNLENVLILNS